MFGSPSGINELRYSGTRIPIYAWLCSSVKANRAAFTRKTRQPNRATRVALTGNASKKMTWAGRQQKTRCRVRRLMRAARLLNRIQFASVAALADSGRATSSNIWSPSRR